MTSGFLVTEPGWGRGGPTALAPLLLVPAVCCTCMGGWVGVGHGVGVGCGWTEGAQPPPHPRALPHQGRA